MTISEQAAPDDDLAALRADNERLRARLVALDAEMADAVARANSAVAAVQERAYWLDRWHVDLNALMRRRGAAEARTVLRAARAVAWAGKRVRRSLRTR